MNPTHHVLDSTDNATIVHGAVRLVVDLATLWWVILGIDIVPGFRKRPFEFLSISPICAVGNVEIGIRFDELVEKSSTVSVKIHLREIAYGAMADFSPA